MIELIALAGLVTAGSLLCGRALARLCGSPAWSPAAPAVGFALLLIVSTLSIGLPGGGSASAGAVVVLVIGSGAILLGRRPKRPRLWALTAGLVAAAAAVIPFAASGRVGILGAGTNDDMAEHLLAAWALQGHLAASASKLVASGYPVGPHSLAAALAQLTGISLERTFTGVVIAVPVLMALTAGELMPRGRALLGGGASAAVGLCYLQSAWLAQGAFKEPIEALMLLGLLVCLTNMERLGAPAGRQLLIAAAIVIAGSVYVYSYEGLAWPLGTILLWALARRLLAPGAAGVDSAAGNTHLSDTGTSLRGWPWRSIALACGALLLLIVPQIARMITFAHSGYAQEGVQVNGDLLRPLPLLEAGGIWPASDFRFAIAPRSIGVLLAACTAPALLLAVLRCERRGELALPAALAVAGGMWGLSSLGSPYTNAKSLAILAPLVTLLLAREMLLMLRQRPRTKLSIVFAAAPFVLLAAGAYSDLKVLRDAPVGPAGHASELASLAPLIGHRPTLVLGADDTIHWELRGIDIQTPPWPLYTTKVVPLRRTKARQDDLSLYHGGDRVLTTNRFSGLGLGFDFDSVPTQTLDRFTFVILPRSTYSSTPPPNWRLVKATSSYGLWRRYGLTPPHQTLTEVDNPGAVLDCRTTAGRRIARGSGLAMTRPAPVIGDRWWWRGKVGYAGQSAQMTLFLTRGSWDISLQYASVVPVTLTAPGTTYVLPANLQPLGAYWSAGYVVVQRTQPVRFVLHYQPLPLLGRLLGSTGQTRPPTPTGLVARGRLVASRAPVQDRTIPLHRACGRYVDWYTTPLRARQR